MFVCYIDDLRQVWVDFKELLVHTVHVYVHTPHPPDPSMD